VKRFENDSRTTAAEERATASAALFKLGMQDDAMRHATLAGVNR
jgi:hypothetical protein